MAHIQELTGEISYTPADGPRNIAVTILRAGPSKNGYIYPPQVIAAAAPLFEGATAFCDHSLAHRSVRDVVGSYSSIHPDPDGHLAGTLRLIDGQIARLVEAIIADRTAGLHTPNVGLSVDIIADCDQSRTITNIERVNSVDIVFDPSAGGSLDRLLESHQELTTMPETTPPPPAQEPPAPPVPVLSQTATPAAIQPELEAIRESRLAVCGDVLALRLGASQLPEVARHHIGARFTGRIFEEAELTTAIEEMRSLVGALTGQSFIRNGGIDRIEPGMAMRDRIQAATDLLFGNDVPDAVRTKTPRPLGIRELFQAAGFEGHFGWERTRILEANEVTTSVMANIVGTSINKRLVKDFDTVEKWWKPVVVEVPLRDMKLQTRVKLNDFAALSTVSENGAYTNLAWDDVAETYTPTKRGNLVYITLETIINDDLRAVQSIPKKLARAATMTINSAIVALFTDTSGTGPALADTYHIFDASNHQSNLGSSALDATTLAAGILAIAKMTDTASHRMGLTAKWLLVPPDLAQTAWELANTVLKPGTADNDKNYLYQRVTPITVPGFTDTNNWYLLADPSEVELIEVGYLNDQRTPELLLQDDPIAGTVFTNDAISYKVRWIFGAGWLDYRGAYGAVVA